MILMKPEFEIIALLEPMFAMDPLHLIEVAGRTCYKSVGKMDDGTAQKFVKMVKDKGHNSVLEHSALTVKIICDRGVTHELVRHRLCAYSQESTRYVNYAHEDHITVIEPFFFDPMEKRQIVHIPIPDRGAGGNLELELDVENPEYDILIMNSFDVWLLTCLWTQWGYMTLINQFGRKPQEARSVLPNSTKTEIVVTANFREWIHILTLRTAKGAHPQMIEVMKPLLKELKGMIPVVFDDIPLIYEGTPHGEG